MVLLSGDLVDEREFLCIPGTGNSLYPTRRINPACRASSLYAPWRRLDYAFQTTGAGKASREAGTVLTETVVQEEPKGPLSELEQNWGLGQ